ncbi:NAD(P)H-dependent oxidoreductase [Flavicella marina]|uniref:NAD(P)H-dependent oxidoreductase n=1 Tax=Flavicella marina TaxID=1475951 RepID=UPI001264FAF0|nr:NAD(P)H-dependent oxidoreductase [Flavicella marina]
MKKILLINGHPNKESFNYGIFKAFKEGATSQHTQIKEIQIGELNFDPNLAFGYQQRTELEPDLKMAWKKIKWADHLVWMHPVWWGGLPAITKGFIDRLFLPGMAFQYKENSIWWDKLLTGKTAQIITTLDQPKWFYRFINKRPSVNQLKKNTLEFCGVKNIKVHYIEMIKNSDEKKRALWLSKIEKLGRKHINV